MHMIRVVATHDWNDLTLSNESRMMPAMLLSSSSPRSKKISAARSRIHPGMKTLPRPVPWRSLLGGIALRVMCVVVEW